jgi:transposase
MVKFSEIIPGKVTMSLNKDPQEELFTATNELKDFLPDDDPMMVFSKTIYSAFKDEDFADCYSTKGRHAKSPSFLALVTLLQFRESLSDTETSEAVVRRLDWKIALHLPIDQKDSFDPSTLCYFRKRQKENDKISLIFDKVLELAQDKGFIKRKTEQRIDATHIISHISRISTTDLLFRAVKCVVEEIEKKDPRYYDKEIPEDIKERYGGRFSSFGMSKEKRGEKLAEIVEDGLYIKLLLEKVPSGKLNDLEQLGIMETIFEENVKIRSKEIEDKVFVEVEEIQTPKQTIFDPRDSSIKMGKKGKRSWIGSKCHVVETAEKGKVNFITNMIYQKANEYDSKIHEKIVEGNKQKGFKPEKLYADLGYISGASIRDYRKRGQELMGYIRGETTPKLEDFKVEKFSIDMEKLEATCPAGHVSINSSIDKNGYIRMSFSKFVCMKCQFFKPCVGSDTKQKRRRIAVNQYYDYIRERRREQKSEEFQKEMSVRAQIEGTISEITRFHGFRHAKYKGETGHQLQFYLTGAVLNIKRLVKALNNGLDLVQTVKV